MKIWTKAIAKFILTVRQADPRFVKILNEMRHGLLSPESVRILSTLNREVKYEDGITPVELYPIRSQVEAANATRLAQLSGETQQYRAIDRLGTFLQWDFQKSEKDKEDLLRQKLDKVSEQCLVHVFVLKTACY